MPIKLILGLMLALLFGSTTFALAAPHNPCLDRPVEERVTGCSTATSGHSNPIPVVGTVPWPAGSELLSGHN